MMLLTSQIFDIRNKNEHFQESQTSDIEAIRQRAYRREGETSVSGNFSTPKQNQLSTLASD